MLGDFLSENDHRDNNTKKSTESSQDDEFAHSSAQERHSSIISIAPRSPRPKVASALIQRDNLFGDCPRCGAVSSRVTTIVDSPEDLEPAIALVCGDCKSLINVSPEGENYSDLLKRIQPRTSRERVEPSSQYEGERAVSALKYRYSPRQLLSRIPTSQRELLVMREKLLNEEHRKGTLKCIVCGKAPPGNFMCHFAMTAGQNYYLFTCDSALCLNKVKGELSRPEKGNVGIGLESGRTIFDQRKKP